MKSALKKTSNECYPKAKLKKSFQTTAPNKHTLFIRREFPSMDRARQWQCASQIRVGMVPPKYVPRGGLRGRGLRARGGGGAGVSASASTSSASTSLAITLSVSTLLASTVTPSASTPSPRVPSPSTTEHAHSAVLVLDMMPPLVIFSSVR